VSYVCIHAHVCHMYVYMRMCVICMYTCACVSYVCMHAHVCHMYVCMRMCAICMYTWSYVSYVHTHARTLPMAFEAKFVVFRALRICVGVHVLHTHVLKRMCVLCVYVSVYVYNTRMCARA
jgi:hypothetical protein